MTVGVAIILALTFTPYALVSRARRAIAAYIEVPASPALVELARTGTLAQQNFEAVSSQV